MTNPSGAIRGFHGVRAFRHRNYRLFFGGQLISLIGTWMQQVAQAWLVLQLTHHPLWLGLVSVAQFGPVIIFGLFGGFIADQLPKRKTLLATQTVAMVLAFILFGLTVTGVVQVWHVMILAVLLGINNSIDMPTRQSFAVEMVGREDMTNAVGLNSAQFNTSRIIGPAVAGLLIGGRFVHLEVGDDRGQLAVLNRFVAHAQLASGGRLIRIASMLPPVFSPNKVPRS